MSLSLRPVSARFSRFLRPQKEAPSLSLLFHYASLIIVVVLLCKCENLDPPLTLSTAAATAVTARIIPVLREIKMPGRTKEWHHVQCVNLSARQKRVICSTLLKTANHDSPVPHFNPGRRLRTVTHDGDREREYLSMTPRQEVACCLLIPPTPRGAASPLLYSCVSSRSTSRARGKEGQRDRESPEDERKSGNIATIALNPTPTI